MYTENSWKTQLATMVALTVIMNDLSMITIVGRAKCFGAAKTACWWECPFTVPTAIEATVALFGLDDKRRKRLAVNLRR
jgi:hypothetical protein